MLLNSECRELLGKLQWWFEAILTAYRLKLDPSGQIVVWFTSLRSSNLKVLAMTAYNFH